MTTARFFPETLLFRILLKDWRRDFFRDFTRDSGPSIARESLGCRVHLWKKTKPSFIAKYGHTKVRFLIISYEFFCTATAEGTSYSD